MTGEFVEVGHAAADGIEYTRTTDAMSFSMPMTIEQTEQARRALDRLMGRVDQDAPARRVAVRVEADERTVFHESAARSMIGNRVDFKVLDQDMGYGTVADAKVIDDGRALMVVIDQTAGEVQGVSPTPPFLASIADLFDPPRPPVEHPPTVQVRRPPDPD